MSKRVTRFVLLSMCVSAALFVNANEYNVPPLQPSAAQVLANEELSRAPLFWMPTTFPYRSVIDANTKKSKDAAELEKNLEYLHKAGQLERNKRIKPVLKSAKPVARHVMKVVWEYQIPNTVGHYPKKGLYYGVGKVKKILSVSPPEHIKGQTVSKIYGQWYVDDMPSWFKRLPVVSSRVLRRAKESSKRPFEKRWYAVYDGQDWRLLDNEP